jgi:hypothetical protein
MVIDFLDLISLQMALMIWVVVVQLGTVMRLVLLDPLSSSRLINILIVIIGV